MTIRGSARATAVRVAPLIAVVLVMAWLQGIDGAGRLTWWGYVCLGLACVLAAPAIANLFWPPTLLLEADALVCRWWWSTTTIKWSDIQAFRVVSPKEQLSRRIPHVLPWNIAISRAGARSKIGLDFRSGATLTPAQARARADSQTLNLCDWAIPNFWDVPSTDLVRRLNDELALHRRA